MGPPREESQVQAGHDWSACPFDQDRGREGQGVSSVSEREYPAEEATSERATSLGEWVSRWRSVWRHRFAAMLLWSRWPIVLPVVLVVAAFGLYLPRIDYPDKFLFDEILHAFTANEYAEGNEDAYSWTHPCRTFGSDEECLAVNPAAEHEPGRVGKYLWDHPPLGKLFMAAGILVFGDNAFGWRIASAVMGAIGIAIAYRLGLRLSGRMSVGVLTAGLLLVDGLYFIYSRMGLVDIFVTVLSMSALLAFAGYLQAPPDQVRWPLFSTGLLLGLGIATKWNAAYVGVCIGVVVIVRMALLLRARWRPDSTPEQQRGLREHLIWVPLALGLVPLAVYVLAYGQFFLEGYSLSQFIDLQQEMYHVHATIRDGNTLASRWWQWPLALSNVWFGNRVWEDGDVATIYANGNPVLYWAFLPSIIWLTGRWVAQRNPAVIVLAIGFFGQWLPWMFIDRSTYTYHFLPSVPFGCVAVAMLLVHLFQGNTGWRRTVAVEYVVLVVLVFAFFYPIYSYFPISEEALALRMWFPSWR